MSQTTNRSNVVGSGDRSSAESSNAYEVKLSAQRQRTVNVLAAVGLVVCGLAGFTVDGGPTLWGLAPIVLFGVLCLAGMDMVIATAVSLLGGVLITQMSLADVGNLLAEGIIDDELVAAIGFIIVLGAGTGEVLRVTGVASRIVRTVMGALGERTQRSVMLGVMLSCLVLVTALGTLAGALAIAAPILIPIAARTGFTRSATAAMMFVGGCAGLALAPFAGSNVAIMDAAEVDYLTYLRYGAAPIAVLSVLVALLVVPWIQRRTQDVDDFYSDAEAGMQAGEEPAHASRTTTVFLVALLVSVVYATISEAGIAFPLLALPALAVITGLAAKLPLTEIASHIYRGGARLLSILLLFWLLAALFLIINDLAPFDVILDQFGAELKNSSGLAFAVAIALLGWVGVPGATAAQVVLLDKVFGPVAATVGISTGAWVIVLLWASKADTYGPFPNANMVGAMGLARSTNLRSLLLTGWLVLIPASLMYVAILAVLA
jgi:Na+/H+ antiporter NhaC